jgi:hypothetical protein
MCRKSTLILNVANLATVDPVVSCEHHSTSFSPLKAAQERDIARKIPSVSNSTQHVCVCNSEDRKSTLILNVANLATVDPVVSCEHHTMSFSPLKAGQGRDFARKIPRVSNSTQHVCVCN